MACDGTGTLSGRRGVQQTAMSRTLSIALLAAIVTAPAGVFAQEGLVPTQLLVHVDSKSQAPTSASEIDLRIGGHQTAVSSWQAATPQATQVAILIDGGLRLAIGREIETLRNFVRNLPPGTEVLIGVMQYGHVRSQGFTTDHAAAAESVSLPEGVPGMSASPYLCLSEFVKQWAGTDQGSMGHAASSKARIALMITDGVDPYNGSTSVLNQDSPYVTAAIKDAQRAGVSVYSIYFGDAGIRGPSADNSGQNYLNELAEQTGGQNYWQGIGNPVSMAPYLDQFRRMLSENYIAGFAAPSGRNPQRDLVPVRISAAHAKLHAPSYVMPGNTE